MSGVWKVFYPVAAGGGLLCDSSASSTTTDCLQEAINAAVNNGYELYVVGTGATGLPQINATTTITFPPMQNQYVRFENIVINLPYSGRSTDGMVFDSMGDTDIEMKGVTLTYDNTGCAVRFSPTNGTPTDHITSIYGSTVRINSVVTGNNINANAIAPLCFDMSHGSIDNGNQFSVSEVNGGLGTSLSAYGVLVQNPSNEFADNTLTFRWVHQFSSAAIQIGQSTANQRAYHYNHWELGGLFPGSASGAADGFDTFGNSDIIDLNATAGTFRDALIVFRNGANSNNVRAGSLSGGTKVLDHGTNNIVQNNGSITVGGKMQPLHSDGGGDASTSVALPMACPTTNSTR